MIDYFTKSSGLAASTLPHVALGDSRASLAFVEQSVTAEFQNRCNVLDESIGNRDDQVCENARDVQTFRYRDDQRIYKIDFGVGILPKNLC